MKNPYHGRPDYTCCRQGVSFNAVSGVDPVVRAPFSIGRDDSIATAGSCFAQHISRTLLQRGLKFLVTEAFSPQDSATSIPLGNCYNFLTERMIFSCLKLTTGPDTKDM